jgi:hypothetical protein
VLAGGDTTQTALRRLTIAVNFEGRDPPLHLDDLDSATATGIPPEPVREDTPEAHLAIRGPGGFPLLAATAIGNWRRSPPGISMAAVADATPGEPTETTFDRVQTLALDRGAIQNQLPRAATPPIVLAADDDTSDMNDTVGDALYPRRWEDTRVTLSFGLSMATFVTFNVILSDPVAGYDYLASRLDRDGRDRYPKRRPTPR